MTRFIANTNSQNFLLKGMNGFLKDTKLLRYIDNIPMTSFY